MNIGPDSLLPMASVFVAVAGFVTMFWRQPVGMLKRRVHKVNGRQFTR